jgi:hypothetical protein
MRIWIRLRKQRVRVIVGGRIEKIVKIRWWKVRPCICAQPPIFFGPRNGPSSHEVQDFLVKFGELLPTIFVSILWAWNLRVTRRLRSPPPFPIYFYSSSFALLYHVIFFLQRYARKVCQQTPAAIVSSFTIGRFWPSIIHSWQKLRSYDARGNDVTSEVHLRIQYPQQQ